MRTEFAAAMIRNFDKKHRLVFMTGDLGYMALEKVQEKFGERFINAGVAEQNMVAMAASLAYEGFMPWVYSISPFVTLRPYEQIRNDVCLHDLPVKLVGNGGGYGYGIMGSTHHNLEDIGSMRLLPNMQVYVPFTAGDVEEAVTAMLNDPHPNYLRLNIAAKVNFQVTHFRQWRQIKPGKKAVLIGTGPVLENVCNLNLAVVDDLEIWLLSIFPVYDMPEELIKSINRSGRIITIEEHNGQCGMRETLSYHLINHLRRSVNLLSLSANGYPSGRYGDQEWHQQENDLAGEGLNNKIAEFIS